GRRLSELLAPYRSTYFITGEINTSVADVALKLQELKERFGTEGRVSHLDGVSIDADDWHMNVRPSNTEPLLRLNLEARSPEWRDATRAGAPARPPPGGPGPAPGRPGAPRRRRAGGPRRRPARRQRPRPHPTTA